MTSPATGGHGYRERAARIALRCKAILTEPDGCRLDVVITELSSSGFRLQSRAELVPGETVMLQADKSAPVRATIHWTRGLEAGGAFLDPVAL